MIEWIHVWKRKENVMNEKKKCNEKKQFITSDNESEQIMKQTHRCLIIF